MVFSEFRRRFDVLAPHLTKKHGRNYIVVDEKRVRSGSPRPRQTLLPLLRPLQAAALPPLERARLALGQVPGFAQPGPGQGHMAARLWRCGEGSPGHGRTVGITEEPPALKARAEGVCSPVSQTVTQEPPRWQIRTSVLGAPLVAPGPLGLDLHTRA